MEKLILEGRDAIEVKEAAYWRYSNFVDERNRNRPAANLAPAFTPAGSGPKSKSRCETVTVAVAEPRPATLAVMVAAPDDNPSIGK